MRVRKFRLTYADLASTLALLVALSGTAYAAVALPKDSVGTRQIKAAAVTAPKVRDGAIKRRKLAPNVVTSAKVADRGITRADLAQGAVGPDELADGSVGTPELADGSVTTVKIGSGQITEGHLFPGSVRSEAVLDESLSLTDLMGAQVTPSLAGFTLFPDECANFPVLSAPGAETGQIAMAGWLTDVADGLVLERVRVSGQNQVGIWICNRGPENASFPGGQRIRIITLG